MGKTRSMNRKKKYDEASGTNRIKTCDKSGVTPWSYLPHDVLLLVMMRLGVVDILAFSGACKSWRSFALSNRNKFIVSKPPMSISIFHIDANETQYYINDFEGRKFKITLPHFAVGRRCIGVTGGYLILFNQKTYDCWLVNLIKRHEIHFPNVPHDVFCCPGYFRAILVFSHSMSGWVLVVLNKCYYRLWFSIAVNNRFFRSKIIPPTPTPTQASLSSLLSHDLGFQHLSLSPLFCIQLTPVVECRPKAVKVCSVCGIALSWYLRRIALFRRQQRKKQHRDRSLPANPSLLKKLHITMPRMFNFLMSKRRRMNRKKKHDDASGARMKKIKTRDNSGVSSWSNFPHDVLLLVMTRLGVVDFIAFSGVCKSWRSFAVYNKKSFMVSKPPMSISTISSDTNEKEYYLNDFEGRKYKITLPCFAHGGRCIGVTGGYLILFNENTCDCWLVNLITRHELHFPDVPHYPHVPVYGVFCCPGLFRAILVFSPSMSEWVLVVLNICHQEIWFCIAGKREWTKVATRFNISDLHAFKGKIYILVSSKYSRSDEDEVVRLCEMELYPKPKLILLKTENFKKQDFTFPRIHELDFGEMKFVSREEKGEKYAFFLNTFMDGNTITLREMWDDIHSLYGRYAVNDKEEKDGFFNANMWYFFDDCFNV
ncbi:unnamed protein product [Lactuca virosa]|uniref:F-box domain-containing protein n=1 Tax=Lactuca virosa TaxID=75947 RepID=A0AAU9PIG3_9ASTR|nr:unnamed protein product [Lactuca virosa]